MKPFGVSVPKINLNLERRDLEGMFPFLWLMTVVPLAPAIAAGYIANFVLETKYLLTCEGGDGIGEECVAFNGGVCCTAYNSREDWMPFVRDLASSCLAGDFLSFFA